MARLRQRAGIFGDGARLGPCEGRTSMDATSCRWLFAVAWLANGCGSGSEAAAKPPPTSTAEDAGDALSPPSGPAGDAGDARAADEAGAAPNDGWPTYGHDARRTF